MALLLLLLLAGAVNVAATLVSTRLYVNEALQQQNRDLAYNIASMKYEGLIDAQGDLRSEGINEILHWMMVVNPGPHFYVLDLRGQVMAYDSSAGEPEMAGVSLAPIRQFLEQTEDRSPGAAEIWLQKPIFGDDPREPGEAKIFSVAMLPPQGRPVGYLYVVLEDQSFESTSVAERLRRSYILRLSLKNGLVALSLVLAIGFLTFAWLTRPLRRLADRMAVLNADSSGDPAGGLEENGQGGIVPPDGLSEVELLEWRFDELCQRIQRQVEDLERMADVRRELLTNVSHDLRTPIATLRGYLETLGLHGGLDEAQRAEYLAIALRQSERLGRLVDELLELATLDRHEMSPRLERFRLAELVQDNVQRFRLRAQQRGVTLESSFDHDLPPVFVDVSLMERALENLIENAIRHTEAGGKVTVELREEPHRLVLSVIDTGGGIEAAELPYIFERFRSNGDGAGLGLAITQRIAELHGASVEVESEVGQGTTFSFSLAAAPRSHRFTSTEMRLMAKHAKASG